MKKTMMFLGVLSLGLAQAQQGNVGINTDEPKATLEIKPTATNLAGTTNEGIVAPKLSKTRVAGIAEPVEGTLVYVTDEATSTIASYTGSDVKVAKIDEKGYYFFDGTEWVKTSNEWVYDATTNRIYLKRSGDTNGTFKNSIFYNADTGQYVDIDDENKIRGVRLVTTNRNVSFEETTSTLSNDIKYKNYIHSESKNLHSSIARSTDGTETTYKQLGSQTLVATEEDNTDRMNTVNTSIVVPPGNSNNFVSVYGNGSGTSLFGTGEIANSLGQSGGVTIGNSQNVKGYITGFLGTSAVQTSGNIGQVYGVFGRNFFYSPTGANVTMAAGGRFSNSMPLNDNSLIKQFMGIFSEVRNSSQNAGTGQYLAGVYSTTVHQGKTKYPNMYGIFTSSTVDANATAPNNHYGVYINNVKGGLNGNYGLYVNNVEGNQNHAIYTGTGKVRFGDNTRIKTDTEAPTSALTVNGVAAFGRSIPNFNRSVFAGNTEGNMLGGTFVGFGAYADITENKFKTAKDNHSLYTKGRFFMFNALNGKFYFSPLMVADGKVEEEFNPVDESALTIVHEGKKVGVGTNNPKEKLEVAGAVKIGTTDTNCTTTNAGIIRFDATAKKFQGCTGDAWVDLH